MKEKETGVSSKRRGLFGVSVSVINQDEVLKISPPLKSYNEFKGSW